MLAEVCASLPELVGWLEQGAGFALVTEEGLRDADLRQLSAWLHGQPEWSDFPFILLTRKGGGIERNPAARRYLDILGNVTFLERPFHPTTLISLAQAALRGRRRQYEARSRLEELRSVAEKYRSLFESLDVGFCVVELDLDDDHKPVDYHFIEANPAFERQTGLRDVVGRSVRSLLPSYDEHGIQVYADVATSRSPIRFERYVAPLGSWFEAFAFPTGHLEERRVAILFNDITERRRLEQSLRDNEERLKGLNESLEARVVERSKELARAQDALRQSQKLESIGQLTGGVAHDFNNLLMAIMSSLSLLEKRLPGDPAIQRLIDNARQGAERGAALTQRMLAFARRQDLSPATLDVSKLVGEMVQLVERTIGPEWPLDIRIPASIPPVVADANQLEMAILNLAVNARDAMPSGGQIVISAEERSFASGEFAGLRDGAYIGLSVIDTGVGMDAETLERATEPFFTTKGIGKGTGLGLPMIHGLAKQLGGTFALVSQIGAGTRATLWLPAAATASEDYVESVDEDAEVIDQSLGLKILAVDDDPLILMNTAALIEDLGHAPIEASSGHEAVAALEANHDIDLLITDQAMPGMTGTQLVEKVNVIRPKLPIILATGYGEVPPGFAKSIVKLNKPFSQADLRKAIDRAVSAGRV